MQKIIFNAIQQKLENRTPTWMITVIATEGSTPGKVGMKMVIDIEGETIGTVGGGSIEHLVIRKTLQEKPSAPLSWSFDLGDEISSRELTKTGMICGGNDSETTQRTCAAPIKINPEL